MTESTYPLSILWAHPRSMSTAMERIMRERGDCLCMHEPFMYYHYVHLGKKVMPHFERDTSQPTTFADIVAALCSEAMHQPVFAKDMAYYVWPEISRWPQFAKRTRHIFLLRDLRKSLLSYFKLDPHITDEEVGVNSQWTLFQWLQQQGDTPLVLLAERVQAEPLRAASTLWCYQGLDRRPEALHWNKEQPPADWLQVGKWHQKTMDTSRIKADRQSEDELAESFSRHAAKNPRLETLRAGHWQSFLALKRIGETQWRESGSV